jgi:hypothetical protein
MSNLWLQFHETGLCQEIDAVFVFGERSLEVWCRPDSSRAMEKLRQRIEPLRASFQVELYVTRTQPGRQKEERRPPPSFSNNQELAASLRDPRAWRAIFNPGLAQEEEGAQAPDPSIQQRMLMFADRLLEMKEQMRRYALDLPALAACFSGGRPTEMAARARLAFLAHAGGLERCAERLEQDLKQAMPRPGKASGGQRRANPASPAANPEAAAAEIARTAEIVSRRVYRFIYPDEHTVGLADLQNPSLLEALRNLGGTASALRRGGGRP